MTDARNLAYRPRRRNRTLLHRAEPRPRPYDLKCERNELKDERAGIFRRGRATFDFSGMFARPAREVTVDEQYLASDEYADERAARRIAEIDAELAKIRIARRGHRRPRRTGRARARAPRRSIRVAARGGDTRAGPTSDEPPPGPRPDSTRRPGGGRGSEHHEALHRCGVRQGRALRVLGRRLGSLAQSPSRASGVSACVAPLPTLTLPATCRRAVVHLARPTNANGARPGKVGAVAGGTHESMH